MAIRLETTPPRVRPENVSPLQNLIQILRRNYAKPEQLLFCHLHPQKFGYTSIDQMVEKATRIFQDLERRAHSGKTGAMFIFEPIKEYNGIVSLIVVLKALQNNLELQMTPLSVGSTAYCGTFCHLYEHEVSFEMKWNNDNPHLLPKPAFDPQPTEVWGYRGLFERFKGQIGTDCTLVFGEIKIPAHRLIAARFSPVFEKMVEGQMLEAQSGVLPFPKVNFSKEELQAFMGFMYTQEIDLKPFPSRTLLEFINWSYSILAPHLRNAALETLLPRLEKLEISDLLYLLFINSQHQEDLKTYTSWLLTMKPDFYKDLFKSEPIERDDLLMAFAVARFYHLDEFQKGLESFWNKISTKEKTDIVIASLENKHPSLLDIMEDLCRLTFNSKTILPTDPDRKEFVDAYKALNRRVLELRTDSIDLQYLPK